MTHGRADLMTSRQLMDSDLPRNASHRARKRDVTEHSGAVYNQQLHGDGMNDDGENQRVSRALVDLIFPSSRGGSEQTTEPTDTSAQKKRGARELRILRALSLVKQPHCSAVVIARPNMHTLIVRWSDSLGGHYGDQTWKRSVSTASGLCAATGRPIRGGERIFRPVPKGAETPFNNDRMISVRAIRDNLGDHMMASDSDFGIEPALSVRG